MTGVSPSGRHRASSENCGSPGELLPARGLQDWVGLRGPNAIGNEYLGYLVDLCGLRPGDAVLDVGCGSGRMAVPLTGYLTREGRYAGFDISREAVAWCTQNISGAHPNFDFTVVDIQNGAYNPTGTCKASDFRFPYPDGSFDVVLLASLFTHMLPSDMQHYLHEIVRVLKPGGRSLITFFLLNEESSALITEGKGWIKFEHEMPGYRMTHVEIPEAAIAYPEDFVRYLYAECGLVLREPLRYGTWCGRTNAMSGQDVVIAVKAASRNRLTQEAHMDTYGCVKGGSMTQLSGVEPLSRGTWVFCNGDGVVFSRDFELRNDGTIGGYDDPNERRWREDNGAIVVTREDGTITCCLLYTSDAADE